MISVGNDRIHIHRQIGEQNKKFRFRKSSWDNTALNMGCKFDFSVVFLSGGSGNLQPHIRTLFFF